MLAQQPAQGILQSGDWGSAKSYHIICGCGQPDHCHDLWIEAEDVGLNVSIHTRVESKWWSLNRFKQIWTLLTKGYLEQEVVLIMDEQTALNYAETLKAAIKDVKNFKKS